MPWRRPLRSHQAQVALSLTVLLSSCGGGGDVAPPATPAGIDVSSGNRQTGTAGAPLPQPLSARVTSAAGSGIEGATVTFAASANSGTLATGNAVTDADGIASTTWTLGTAAGANVDTVRASVGGVGAPAIFTATVTAAAAAGLTEVSGNSQGGIAGQALAQPLVVLARDQFGNPTSHVGVAWTVTSGGGTVSPSTSATGADGLTSAIWTPGDAAVNTVQAAVPGLAGPTVSFGATITTTPSRLSLVGGNSQSGSPGELLAQPLVVSLKTQAGATVVGVAVSWVVTSGGGTVSQASVPADGQGQSSVLWTLGPGEGQQSATATVSGAIGSPVSFSATAVRSSGVVTLTAVTPTPIVIGQPATLTGTGFSSNPANNDVTIDGVTATVSSATATSLAVSVPHFNCLPARSVTVQVTVAGEASNVLTHHLNPSSFLTVGIGQLLVLDKPGEFCLQFAPSTTAEDYLIGVQSTSEVVTSLTPVTLTTVAAPAASAAHAIAPVAIHARPIPTAGAPSIQIPSRWQRHREGELQLRDAEDRILSRLGKNAFHDRLRSGSTLRATSSIPIVSVGDVIPMRVPNANGNICTSFASVNAVVRVVGAKGVWLEDLANPVGGYSAEDFQLFSDLLDGTIYPTAIEYFGTPSDIDGNGRLAILVTKEVNRFSSLLGFVVGTDLVSRSTCPSSAEGEIYYGIAPDPSGTFAFGPYSRNRGIQDSPGLIAHEFTHVIQVSRRRVLSDLPNMVRWTAEGQATLAEEVVGYQFEGRSSAQNYGFDVAFNQDDPSSIDWYSTRFLDLAGYFGVETRDNKIPGAPEECTWLEQKPANAGPCIGGRDVYGTPWSFLRWLSDQFGSDYPGGEREFQRALIDVPGVGYSNITDAMGLPLKPMLAQWAATLYTDDRVPMLDRRLTLPSWNLFDIFDLNLVEAARLVPRSRGFSSFTETFRVRAGSSAYFRLSGTSHPGTAIRVRNGSDGQLPSIMQVFIVRLQ